MSVEQFDELIRSFFAKYLDRAAIILITSVIGVPGECGASVERRSSGVHRFQSTSPSRSVARARIAEKLLRVNPTMKKPDKAKFDPVVGANVANGAARAALLPRATLR